MRKLLVAAFLLLITACLHAQDSTAIKNDTIPPQFAGGQQGWIHFLEKNVHVMVPVKEHAPDGTYSVTVSFMVDTLGKVYDIKIIKDPGYGMGDDVTKAFKHCPAWTSATLHGVKIPYREQQNVSYQLSGY